MTRDDERLSGHPEVVEALARADAAGPAGRRPRALRRPTPTPEEVTAWQADYDDGCPVTVIAEAAGAHPTTVAAWIDTTGRPGRRPVLTPDDAITAVQEAGGVIRRAAAQLDVSPATVRLALYRAGLVVDPTGRRRPSLDWEQLDVRHGSGWDIDERITIRDARLREMAGQSLDDDEIADRTGVDITVVRTLRRSGQR